MLNRNKYLILLIFWIVIVFVLSLVSFRKIDAKPPTIEHIDKLVHFIFYFVMTFLFMCFFKRETNYFTNFYKRALICFLTTLCIGVFVEYLQENFTETRKGDLKDVCFNVFGSIIAILLSRKINLKD